MSMGVVGFCHRTVRPSRFHICARGKVCTSVIRPQQHNWYSKQVQLGDWQGVAAVVPEVCGCGAGATDERVEWLRRIEIVYGRVRTCLMCLRAMQLSYTAMRLTVTL